MDKVLDLQSEHVVHDLSEVKAGANLQSRAYPSNPMVWRPLLAWILDKRAEVKKWQSQMEARSTWLKGHEGEAIVADFLKRLGPQWQRLHSIKLVKGDIDHLVIGPGGIFVINTKNHASSTVWASGDTVWINGQPTSYISKSRNESLVVEGMLRQTTGRLVQVRGIIAVAQARKLTIKSQPRDSRVEVLAAQDLVPWLKAQRRVMDDRLIQEVYQCARNPAAWGAIKEI